MKSIILLLCSLLSYSLIAQPTTLDMKERYYMKGEKDIVQLRSGSNPLMATKDENGNYFYVGSALFDGKSMGMIGTYIDGVDITYSRDDAPRVYDCIAKDDFYFYAGNGNISKKSIINREGNNQKNVGNKGGIGYQRMIICANEVVVAGITKKNSPMTPACHILSVDEFDGSVGSSQNAKDGYFPDNDGYKLKNDMIATNNEFVVWAYNTKENFNDYSTAAIGLFAIFNKEENEPIAFDKVNIKSAVDKYVSDFRPFTSYENKAYEQVYKVQWAISGIHPKEDGTFLITASFIHWTTTSSGKAGYQKGILGVEYDPNGSDATENTWVAFPWDVKEASSMQEKTEINPYYTHYIGENDIAVFDQETGHLFAINSDLDACKNTDELGTCAKKSKELQRWLINNRVIAKIEGYDYFLNFVNSNTAHENGEKKSIHLICNQKGGSQFQTITLDFK